MRALILAAAALLLVAAACSGSGSASPTPSAPTAVPPTIAPRPTSTPTGPHAEIDPDAGPPGTPVTVSGAGWPAGAAVTVGLDAPDPGPPYASGVVGPDGSFSLPFRLEKLPNGEDLVVGALNLRVTAGDSFVRLRYSVQTRRPILPTVPAG